MKDMENKVQFEEVKPIFECYKYWVKNDEYYWYENMWSFLEQENLTSYEDPEGYNEIILMAVVLVIIFTEHIELKYDLGDLHDSFYSYVVSDMITEFNLGALYYKYNKSLDCGEEDYDYVVEYLAKILKDKVYNAIKNKIGSVELFLSMEAVDEGIKTVFDEEECEDKIFKPGSAKEFWDEFKANRDEIMAKAENNYINVKVYGWVEDGCSL